MIVNVCVLLVPPLVVTVTVLAPAAAVLAITKSAVIDVALTTVTLLTVTFEPLTATVAPETKFVPVNVTDTVLPCTPDVGLMLVKVGAGGLRPSMRVPGSGLRSASVGRSAQAPTRAVVNTARARADRFT